MAEQDLFTQNAELLYDQPLAERLRPQTLADFVGQRHLLEDGSPLLKNLRASDYLPSLILWGPPGTGKTTFARLLSYESKAHFISCNAIETGAKNLREIGLQAHNRRIQFREKTILFIDEIHRLNKSQQDVLLPFTESGDFSLIGATTENPSYELNSALLSRAQVILFKKLSNVDLEVLLQRAAQLLQIELSEVFTFEARKAFLSGVGGDARQLLNFFESVAHIFKNKSQPTLFPIQLVDLEKLNFSPQIRYDKSGDEHHDTISAFIKSIRGSDPDAAIYYLARMLTGGEDPVFIARRLVVLASEDIGNADPKALSLAVAGLQAVELVGMPEARINLAQVTVYLASAPKSNRSYVAINEALRYVEQTGALPIPLSLRSAQTQLVKKFGFGEDYKYSHDSARGYIRQQFLPDEVKDQKFYEPSNHGFEKNIQQYLAWLKGEKL